MRKHYKIDAESFAPVEVVTVSMNLALGRINDGRARDGDDATALSIGRSILKMIDRGFRPGQSYVEIAPRSSRGIDGQPTRLREESK